MSSLQWNCGLPPKGRVQAPCPQYEGENFSRSNVWAAAAGHARPQSQQQSSNVDVNVDELFISPLPEILRVIAILVGIIAQLEKGVKSASGNKNSLWLVELWYPFAEEGLKN